MTILFVFVPVIISLHETCYFPADTENIMSNEEDYKVIDECMGEEETPAAAEDPMEGVATCSKAEDAPRHEASETSAGMVYNISMIISNGLYGV